MVVRGGAAGVDRLPAGGRGRDRVGLGTGLGARGGAATGAGARARSIQSPPTDVRFRQLPTPSWGYTEYSLRASTPAGVDAHLPRLLLLLGATFAFALLTGCPKTHTPPRAAAEIRFVRGGIAVRPPTPGHLLKELLPQGSCSTRGALRSGRHRLLHCAWRPAQRYTAVFHSPTGRQVELTAAAPDRSQALKLHALDLASSLPLPSPGALPSVPSMVTFSPDGSKLLVGTSSGRLLLFDTATGRRAWRHELAEGMTKLAVFSADGRSLFVGEQALDGYVYAFDVKGWSVTLRWRHRLADLLGTGRPADARNAYAWARYPGPYALIPLSDGDLLVAASRSWRVKGRSLARSALLRLAAGDGKARWRWPRSKLLARPVTWMSVSRAGGLLAAAVSARTTGSFAGGGALVVLDLARGRLRTTVRIPPLRPYYKGVFFWRGVALSPDGTRLAASTGDGRAFIFALEGGGRRARPIWSRDLATPFFTSRVPVVASSGMVAGGRRAAYFFTGTTFFQHAASTALVRPSAQHPNGNSVFVVDWQGRLLARRRLPAHPQAYGIDRRERVLAVAVSRGAMKQGSRGYHGVLIFPMIGGVPQIGRSYVYRVEGRVPYDGLAVAPDGQQVALLESGHGVGTAGKKRGRDRAHLVR